MRPEAHGCSARPGSNRQEPRITLTIDSSMLSVRSALVELRAKLDHLSLGSDIGGTIELVVAEVLNNICEHAYRDTSGTISLSVWNDGEVLFFEIRDHGAPMPFGRLPVGRAVPPSRSLEDLPEGGFGWNLIRQLTSDLSYARFEGKNHLTFRMQRSAQIVT